MKKENWIIVPEDSYISFEIPSGNYDSIQGYCSNLKGNIESPLHEFEDAKLLLDIPVKYLSISDRYLSSLLSPLKKNPGDACTLLHVEGVISETNLDEIYTFHGILSSVYYRKRFAMYVTGGKETNVSGDVAESYFDFTGQLDTSGLWPKGIASIITWKDLSTLMIVRGRIKIKGLHAGEHEKPTARKPGCF